MGTGAYNVHNYVKDIYHMNSVFSLRTLSISGPVSMMLSRCVNITKGNQAINIIKVFDKIVPSDYDVRFCF